MCMYGNQRNAGLYFALPKALKSRFRIFLCAYEREQPLSYNNYGGISFTNATDMILI